MIGIGATLDKAKTQWFQAEMLIRKIGKMDEYALKFVGAYVRRRAQTSLRPGGKKYAISSPGQPPRTHGQRLLRTFLEFDIEKGGQSVVVGPAKLNWINYDVLTEQPVKGTIPRLLEEGGQFKQKQAQLPSGLWVRFDHRRSTHNLINQVQLSGGLWVRADDPRALKRSGRPSRTLRPASSQFGLPTRFVVKTMQQRPYMIPALNAEIKAGTIAKAWQDALMRVAGSLGTKIP